MSIQWTILAVVVGALVGLGLGIINSWSGR